MSTAIPDHATPVLEQATGPGWPGEDHDRDALLTQDPGVTYQPAETVLSPPFGTAATPTAAPAQTDWART